MQAECSCFLDNRVQCHDVVLAQGGGALPASPASPRGRLFLGPESAVAPAPAAPMGPAPSLTATEAARKLQAEAEQRRRAMRSCLWGESDRRLSTQRSSEPPCLLSMRALQVCHALLLAGQQGLPFDGRDGHVNRLPSTYMARVKLNHCCSHSECALNPKLSAVRAGSSAYQKAPHRGFEIRV